MNRVYKFRAWDEKSKMWDNSVVINTLGHISVLFCPNIDVFPMQVIISPLDDFSKKLFKDYKKDIPEIVLMQFTGLLDKNGKECFEGDRVQNNLSVHRGIVGWDIESACFAVLDDEGKWVASMGAFNSDGFTIKGNIYENR